MSPSWIRSDKITNERVARVGYNHFISNKSEWNNCFSKFSNRVWPPIFIFTILQSGKFLNLAHYFPYDVKLRLLADSRSFLANQKARNAIVGAENLLKAIIPCPTNMVSIRVNFWGRCYFHFNLVFHDFEGFLIKTIIPLALVGYEMIIANSALRASLAIQRALAWNNC